MEKYYRFALGFQAIHEPLPALPMTVKELANRFLEAQQTNWHDPAGTLRLYVPHKSGF